MSGKHDHKPFEGHMHDFEAHIRAVEEDLDCYPKTKTNMFVTESKDQAAIFSVLSVASISR